MLSARSRRVLPPHRCGPENSAPAALGVSCRSVGSRGTAPGQPGRRTRHHLPDALDARRVLGRPSRHAVQAGVLQYVPACLAAQRLGNHHRPGQHCDHGRSDSTLNRHGVRLGSAEIYEALQSVPQILDALIVGVDEPGGGYWMPLFVVLADEATVDTPLKNTVRKAIRDHASPRHVPDDIIAVPVLPRTRTGKRLEVPVKRSAAGR